MSKTGQIIELEIAEQDVTFVIERDHYIKFINQVNPSDKYKAAHNLLVATVVPEHKSSLMDILARHPSNATSIAGAVMEEYIPDLAIVAKKPKASATK